MQPYCGLLFGQAIFDPDKQLENPECFFEVDIVDSVLEGLRFRNRKALQAFLSFFSIYMLFVLVVTIYDAYVYILDDSRGRIDLELRALQKEIDINNRTMKNDIILS